MNLTKTSALYGYSPRVNTKRTCSYTQSIICPWIFYLSSSCGLYIRINSCWTLFVETKSLNHSLTNILASQNMFLTPAESLTPLGSNIDFQGFMMKDYSHLTLYCPLSSIPSLTQATYTYQWLEGHIFLYLAPPSASIGCSHLLSLQVTSLSQLPFFQPCKKI